MGKEKFKCSHTDVKKVSELLLIQNPKNNNKHSKEQIDRLAKIIDFQGQRSPIVISKRSGFLTRGHGRLFALDKLKWEYAAVDYQDYNTEAEEYADMTADNEIARWAEFNTDKFLEDIKTVDLGDFELLGLKELPDILGEEKKELTDPDDIPEVVDPKAKLGQIYKLGDHRLMCGDSTSIDAVEKLMSGEKADITFTSPPYNAGKNIRGNFYENDSDDKSDDEYVHFLNEFTKNSIEISEYVFVNLQILESNKKALIRFQYDNIEKLKDVLVWNKKQYPPHINKGTFGCKWEYVFAFGKEGKSRSFPCSWQGKFPNVIETENNSGNEFAENHKAGFPVSFPTWVIEKMDFAKSCFDPFMGTGTTMIACEKLGLKSYGIELDPHYVDVIITRWENFTGKKAELLNG